jgi:hypothetical protein
MKQCKGSVGIASLIRSYYTRWRWLFSFILRPPCLRGKSLRTHWIGGWVRTTYLHIHCVLCMSNLNFSVSQTIFQKFLDYFANGGNPNLSTFNLRLWVKMTWLTRKRMRCELHQRHVKLCRSLGTMQLVLMYCFVESKQIRWRPWYIFLVFGLMELTNRSI